MLSRLRAQFIGTTALLCQVPDAPAPQVPPTPPQPAPVVAQPPAPGETPEQRIERLNRAVADTRAEAAAYRIDARTAREREGELTRQLQEAHTAADARVQEVQRNADTHVQSERGLRIEAELKAAAVSAGLADVDLLPLIPRKDIKVDANGNVTGLAEAIATFKASKPSYFRDAAPAPSPAPTRTGINTPPPAPGAAPPTTNLRDMPKADYAATKRAALNTLRRAGG